MSIPTVKCSFCQGKIPVGTPEALNRFHGEVACYRCLEDNVSQALRDAKKFQDRLRGRPVSENEQSLHPAQGTEGMSPFPTELAEMVRAIDEGFPDTQGLPAGTPLMFKNAAGWSMNCIEGSPDNK